ncbi:MAG: LysR family transcriptional regulator [Betaproteobacteria bacterium]|nr:LysR family transcriptional regulator [Betaproteobacteria bacterium]
MKNVTLRQLKVFEAVARHLNYSRAAQELHLSQPAVSMQMKQLEGSAGMPLFEQAGKKIFLTEAGREMQHYARRVTQQLEEAAEALTELKDASRGRLQLTIISTAKYFAPKFVAKFCRLHPGVTLKLDVCNRATLLERLARNETDLVIMGHPPQGLDITLQPFAPNPHVIVAAPEHALARARRIALKRIAEETFLLRESGSGTRLLIERVFAEHGLAVNASMEIGSDETIKQAVMAGMGIGFLSSHTVQLELQAERLVTLDVVGFPIVRNWYIVHRTDKRLSPVARAFKEFLLGEAAVLPHDEPRARPRARR